MRVHVCTAVVCTRTVPLQLHSAVCVAHTVRLPRAGPGCSIARVYERGGRSWRGHRHTRHAAHGPHGAGRRTRAHDRRAERQAEPTTNHLVPRITYTPWCTQPYNGCNTRRATRPARTHSSHTRHNHPQDNIEHQRLSLPHRPTPRASSQQGRFRTKQAPALRRAAPRIPNLWHPRPPRRRRRARLS